MKILIQQETALHQYEVRQSKSKISSLLHPDFLEVGESGNSYNYQSIIEMMEHEKPSKEYIHSQDFECIQLETSVQLLLYKSALVDEFREATNFSKRSSIWLFTGTQWQMKYHQGTTCKPFELTD